MNYIAEQQTLTNRKEKYDRSKTCFTAIKKQHLRHEDAARF